ncbi:hypothetical protein DD559_02805 [Sphingomonas pokkalii]|uniref:Rhodanese domain-containing protein n=2 Tax=Sphingomonas pokkalii TaxID=2175090 RepID=A0A2U0SAJ6_9SPHN|nr:hypothetical protein DD559_02805 [Sphingomonas pokkalii]
MLTLHNVLRLASEYFRPRARPVEELSIEEARLRLEQQGALVFDCNLAEDYARRHLPGARHVGIDPPSRAQLPADRGAVLIFYCSARFCLSSHMAAREAVRLGYHRVCVMPDGIRSWAAAGFPLWRVEEAETADMAVS